MTFARPWVLIGLLVPLAIAVWVWRRQGGRVALPFDYRTSDSHRGWHVAIGLFETLPALLAAVAILLLAGPRQYAEPRDMRILANIELCVDVSGSMASSFGEGTRYDASMAAIDQFVGFREGDAFGLTFFGSSVLHWCPLTNDVSAIRCATPFMRPESVPPWFGGTEIGKALLACKKVLTDRMEGDRMIILVSDGYSSDLGGDNAGELAKQLAAENIAVFAILVGEVEIQSELIEITSTTGGEAFVADDPTALQSIFARIDAMKESRMERTVSEAIDHFEPYLLAGGILLGGMLLGAMGMRYTPW